MEVIRAILRKAAALEVLKTEHRNLTQVLNCLCDEVKRIRGLDEKPDLDLLFSIVYYIRVFPDRYHHPKEDEYLFKRVRQRTHEADQVLGEEDWAAMNNAFLRHDDPMFGENVRADFEALRHRIVKDTDSRRSA